MKEWDLTLIYPSEEAWEEDFNKIKDDVVAYEALKGTLNSAEGFRKIF